MGFCLYLLRHSGVSHDILHRTRPLLEAKERGRWMSDRSLRRYQKPSVAQAQLAKLTTTQQNFGISVRDNMKAMFEKPLLAHNFYHQALQPPWRDETP
jgi:hypothetical protein